MTVCRRPLIMLSVLSVLAIWSSGSFAAIDAYSFPDDESRARYDRLIEELRCPQCLNTSIAGSDSMISKDLRREVHRMIIDGKTDDEILDYMHERYGDFILYKPRLMRRTLLLWFGPLLILLVALAFLGRLIVKRSRVEAEELSEADEARLEQLLKKATPADDGQQKHGG